MANTKIPSELIDGTLGVAGITSSADATAITIDSSENVTFAQKVGIGVTPTHNFNLSSAGAVEARFASTDNDCYLQIASDTDEGQDSVLQFLSGTSARGSITYDHNTTAADQSMIFKTADNASEKLRITGKKMLVTGGETLNTNWGTEFNGIQMGDTHIAGYAGNQSSSRTLFLGANNVWSDANYYRPTDGYSVQLVVNTSQGDVVVNSWGTGSAGQLSSPTNRWKVTQDGEVTAPSQPHIFGSLTNTGGSGIANTYADHAASSRSNLTVNTVSGQKRFTASVAGVYLVSITTIMDSSSVRKDTAIYHNGTKIGQTLNDEATGFHYRCWTHTIEMAANDYILVESDDWYDSAGTTSTVWRRISMTLLS
tara:strand:+ start:2872 stop:3975 length:1104 start_codon:yes stop_codon:yes gene_type:complete